MTIAFVAFAVLLLLPGLLVVRAPWTAVPALSLAFWVLSMGWPLGQSRGRVLGVAVLISFLLALLRLLPKHEVPPPPGWQGPPPPEPPPRPGRPSPRLASGPSLVVLAAALVVVGTAGLSQHAPGPDMAFQTTAARLMVWHDGMPVTGEPLLPLAPFGAHEPALATIASDLSSLSGLDPARAVLMVFVGAIALMLLGLFALEATWLPAAAVAAISGLALAQGVGWLRLWGSGDAFLCLGFVLGAAALLLGHGSRSSAFAAGMLAGAALFAQPLLAAAVWVGCGFMLLSRQRANALSTGTAGGVRRAAIGRFALATAFGLVLAGPGLRPAVAALSARELTAILTSPAGRDMARFVGGLVVVLLAAACARPLAAGTRRARAGFVVLSATAGAVLALTVYAGIAVGQLPAERQRELLRLAVWTQPLDVVCAPAELLDWVPAITGRAVADPGPWIPPIYADEWARRMPRPCVRENQTLRNVRVIPYVPGLPRR